MEKKNENEDWEKEIKKKSKGRQKIRIEKIANRNSLQVTFSKRRAGVFKKASELSALCGAEVAVIVESPAGKVYSFGNPCVDSVINRYETGGHDEDGFSAALRLQIEEESKKKYLEAMGILDKEKAVSVGDSGTNNWWEDLSLDNLGLQELQECMASMEVLKNNLLKRADDLANSSHDVLHQFGALPLHYYNYNLGGPSSN
ncbi:agamous-like MADS-box protein AGL62 [Nicotiana tabacum]|uniref:agamous-like MADS-box protein AGL62 n=1 Tax=Nicotiana tabacum TaxID=4097 RepID=UPI003F4F1B5D